MRNLRLGLAIGLAALASAPVLSQGWVPPIEMADPVPNGVRIQTRDVIGNFLPAKAKGRQPAIMLIGGSEGGLGSGALRMAVELQLAGFNVLQISYYRAPGQPPAFSRIPLETFDRGLAWLRKQPGVDPGRIGVVGASKGAEAALIVAARHRELRAVVAGMPSSHQWAAFSWDGADLPGASWSFKGKDVPYLPYGVFDPQSGVVSLYANGLKASEAHRDAAIEIERSPAPVLLICGKVDGLWPSCPMADTLHKRDPRVSVLAYDDAGHAVFGPPLPDDSKSLPLLASLGGSPAGNNAARKDGWPKVIAFLRQSLRMN